MRSHSGTYQQKLTQVPIRPLIRGVVIVQDINPVSSSDGMKIVLQKGRGSIYVVQKRTPYDYPFPGNVSLQNNNNDNTKSFICMTIKELQYCKSY